MSSRKFISASREWLYCFRALKMSVFLDRAVLNGSSMSLSNKVSDVFKLFHTVFEKYKSKEVFVAFNGGKDCTVLLDLIQTFYKKSSIEGRARVIYIQPKDPFQEIEDFVVDCEHAYGIKIEKLQGNLKTVLEKLCIENPGLKAVIMGSRRTDPYCENLNELQPTDPGWPPLMRISPVLDWTCKDIWDYIRSHKVAYCKLYDEGYTSIGDKTNTVRNPHLIEVDPVTGETVYRAAYELLDDKLERAGRL